jgi:preprotein translocase subunit SecD
VRFLRVATVGTCLVVTFALIWSRATRKTYEYTYRLAEGQGAAEAARILQRRADALRRGFRVVRASVEPAGADKVVVRARTSFDPEPFMGWLMRPGRVELWLAHPDPEILKRNPEGPYPAGYEVKELRETQYLLGQPGETQEVGVRHLVKSEPEWELGRLRGVQCVTMGVDRVVELTFTLGPEDEAAFERLTASNVGRMLGFSIDGELCSVGRIGGRVAGGQVRIRGYLHVPTARRWAALLDGGSLAGRPELIERTVAAQ